MGNQDNYRLIVDCLLNIPLLFWASTVTQDKRYREVAVKHYHTTIDNAIREDSSAYHTFSSMLKRAILCMEKPAKDIPIVQAGRGDNRG